ncbi:aspartate kinase [Gallaecimonas mangrovi]|uniref:aspartate kinase n=1 Tax=Gallaecimonas mangrovi TaxID=2291597 RepID=UPI000E204EC8|nr:aspartate kinase [Gallaecimonas mangrovi]
MALFVQKFGGTSVGTLARIEAVAERLIKSRRQGHDLVVVVSAMAGETNRLLGLAQQLTATPDPRELDVLLATGEQTTIALLAMALKKRGQPALSLTGDQVRIHTDPRHGKAQIQKVDTAVLNQALARGQVVIVAGFQGRGADNAITTLGRGGSDTTAVALAAALNADECQIFTDVDGVYTTDPRIEPAARCLAHIDFESMRELAAQGAKVLQVKSVEYAGRNQVPLRVLSSFHDNHPGTLVTFDDNQNVPKVSGIACCEQSVVVKLSGSNIHALSQDVFFKPLQDVGIDADLLKDIEVSGKEVVFTVPFADFGQALPIIKASVGVMDNIILRCEQNVAKVAIVGNDVGIRPDIASIACGALSDQQIAAELFTTSAKRITFVVASRDGEKAVRLLHRALICE